MDSNILDWLLKSVILFLICLSLFLYYPNNILRMSCADDNKACQMWITSIKYYKGKVKIEAGKWHVYEEIRK